MTLLAKLIGKEEGFGVAGVLPTVRNNPGDLRHSPHSSHVGIGANDIGKIGTVADGWGDLERQLQIDAKLGYTLGEAIYKWAPAGDGANDPGKYLNDVIGGFRAANHPDIFSNTSLTEVLRVLA
jgi:hypothetical protein